MSKRYSIAEARDNLAAILHELVRTGAVEITRRGEPVAMLLSKAEYDRLQSRSTVGFWQAYKAYTEQVDLMAAGIEPSELLKDLRDPGSGRGTEL